MRLLAIRFLALSAVLLTSATAFGQTNYYWNGTGSVATLSSWGRNTNGSGTNPINFIGSDLLFNIQNAQSATLDAAWTVNGIGSRLVVQTGGAFNGSTFNPTLTVNLASGSIYRVDGTYGALIFGTVDANSTFIFAGSSGFRPLGYGNFINQSTNSLNLTGSLTAAGDLRQSSTNELRGAINAGGSGINIGRDLIVDTATTLNLANGTANTTFNIARNLTNSGTISKPGTGSATLNFSGTGTGTATWGTFGTATTAVTVGVANGRTVTFASNYTTSATRGITNDGTLNLGSGATLAGTGTVSGSGTITVLTGGTIRGDSGTGTGTLTLTSTTVASGGAIAANVAATGTNSALALGSNSLNLATNSKLALTAVTGFSRAASSYTIASFTSGSNIQLDGVGQADNFLFGKYVEGTGASGAVVIDTSALNFALTSGDTFALSRTGNNLVLQFTPVPEPATVLAVGAAGLAVVGWVRRRRRAATVTA